MELVLILCGGMIALGFATFLIYLVADGVHFIRTGKHRNF